MALDEPKETDFVQEEEGFRVVADRALVERTGGLVMDYHTGPYKRGFHVKAKNQAAGLGC